MDPHLRNRFEVTPSGQRLEVPRPGFIDDGWSTPKCVDDSEAIFSKNFTKEIWHSTTKGRPGTSLAPLSLCRARGYNPAEHHNPNAPQRQKYVSKVQYHTGSGQYTGTPL